MRRPLVWQLTLPRRRPLQLLNRPDDRSPGRGALDVALRKQLVGSHAGLDSGVGVCGKGGQSVPAGVGQPTLLIDGLTVGGTAA